MRRATSTALGEAVIALLCVIGAVLSWGNGVVTTTFAPIGDLPAFDSTRYVAPWLVLAAFLVCVAGLLVIDGAARVVRSTGQIALN
ncbi:hypothetical protein OG225_30755 [Nocardia sp. NBC_01377]|uniref:hypothetical protein n=1 Tax=Nocardia sp. NBC_01377 TaxID=2903595 RepID=UPI003253E2DF